MRCFQLVLLHPLGRACGILSPKSQSLDAPVGRVAALDTWVGYHPQLEDEILPQVEHLAREAERLLGY